MLNVICERIGTRHLPECVDILYDMIARNLPEGTEGEFHLYTDQPDNYRPEVIVHAADEERRPGLNLSLDHLILGPLDEIASAGRLSEEDVCFYWDGPYPEGAKIVKCLGKPPHELGGWVKHVWKIGGGTASSFTVIPNISVEKRAQNVRSAMKRANVRWFKPLAAHDWPAILIGGGPSLADDIPVLKLMAGDRFAVNNVPRYLAEFGITPDVHVLMDAHPHVANFVAPEIKMNRMYASQCDPSVLDIADDLICWHAASDCLKDIDDSFSPMVGGGSTTAMRTLVLAYGMGYRKFHLFGLDSSLAGDKSHAYEQHGYDNILDVTCGEETFKASPQLIGQAEDFKRTAWDMIQAGCEINVHGGGLLRTIADQFLIQNNVGA